MNRTPLSTKIAFASGFAFVTIFVVSAGGSVPWAHGHFGGGFHGGGFQGGPGAGMAHAPMFHPSMQQAPQPAFHAQPAFHSPPAMFHASQPAYQPQRSFYHAPQPVYQPQRSYFHASQPVYQPQRSFYQASQPVYQPQRAYYQASQPAYQPQPVVYHVRPAYQPQQAYRPQFAAREPMRWRPGWMGHGHFAHAALGGHGPGPAPQIVYAQRHGHGGGYVMHGAYARGGGWRMADGSFGRRHGRYGAMPTAQYAYSLQSGYAPQRYFDDDYGARDFTQSDQRLSGVYYTAPPQVDEAPPVQAYYEAPPVETYGESPRYVQPGPAYASLAYTSQDAQIVHARARSYRHGARVVYLADPPTDYQLQANAEPTPYCPPRGQYRRAISVRY